MIINVKVITTAKQNKITELRGGEFKVYLTCVPEKGKANNNLLKLLSEYFDVSKSQINIISGKKSHSKVIEIKI